MIKRFCDICEKEIKRNYAQQRLTVTKGRIKVEVIVTVDSVANSGEICLDCLLETINSVREHTTPEVTSVATDWSKCAGVTYEVRN